MAPPRKSSSSNNTTSSSSRSWLPLSAVFIVPVAIAAVVYRVDTFPAAPLPADLVPSGAAIAVPERIGRILGGMERVGDGILVGPEDLAYDPKTPAAIYTGCSDGWIKRIAVAGIDPAVENYAYVGGRPLGLAFEPDGTLIVAEPDKGLMSVKKDGTVELLAEAAEGMRLQMTDGVDVASDGAVYFTDASSKYSFATHFLDIMEGRPHGRLLKFQHPNTTTVLLRDLYFANGVAIAPDQNSLVFCETVVRRCMRYHLHGEKNGTTDVFIDNLPGFPDNIRYDGEGRYWIGIATGRSLVWDLLLKHAFLRKTMVVMSKFVRVPTFQRDAGVLSVGLDGKPISLYSDPGLHGVTAGLKVGSHLYVGFLTEPYIGRIDLAATATATATEN